MRRREFVEKLGIGSAALVAGGGLTNRTISGAQNDQDEHHNHRPLLGPLANATVSFGQWKSQPPLDRYANPGTPPDNSHLLLPYVSLIKAGGAVNFIISGLHHVVVYAPGKSPNEVNKSLLRFTTGAIPNVPLINDPVRRIYAGLDPGPLPFDRVEVVHFANRGLHLVICGVLPHFEDEMWGYVRVV